MFQAKSTKFFLISSIRRVIRFIINKKFIFAIFVFLPGFAEFPQFAFAQELLEDNFSLFMPNVSVNGDNLANRNFSCRNIFSESEIFINKNSSEYFSSNIKLFSPVSAYGEAVSKQSTDKESNYPESRMRDYTNKQIVQCFCAFILVMIGYSLIGFVILFPITSRAQARGTK